MITDKLDIIVTQGPYSTFFEEIVDIDCVSGIRINTVMPIKSPENKLIELKNKIKNKNLWIDLKGKQLRVIEFANTPYTSVKISHKIKVNLPATIYFDNGNIEATVVDIDGNQLIIEDYVGRLIGPGESVNIPDESLEYSEFSLLTEKDMEYVEVCKKLDINTFMLSFVESENDLLQFKEICKDAKIISKIENKKGFENLEGILNHCDFIMAARGDLFTEIDYPHEISFYLKKLKQIGKNKSIVASRFFESLLKKQFPSCSDIMDISYLKDMGYNNFMIGDDICFKKEILIKAINIFKSTF